MGFDKYTPVNEALAQFITSYTKQRTSPKTETVNLHEAANRVLSEDFISPIDNPPFDRSAMDGYVVIAAETKGASSKPVILKVIGRSYAGDAESLKISSGQAVAVATGARIPQGADAVVMVEFTAVDGGDKNSVRIFKEISRNKNVAFKGEDLKKGQVILHRGTWLKPQDIGLIASVGVSSVKVYCKPKVAVFATGSELVQPGTELKKEGILYNSNSFMLCSLVREYGGEAIDLGVCKDDEDKLLVALKKALQYDFVVMSGGSSVGERDFVPAVINRAGKPGVLIHGVSMRPGSPTALSLVDGKPVLSAPGYPVAAYLAFYTFGRPLLFSMLRTAGQPEAKIVAKLTASVKLHEGMRAFVRVKLSTQQDKKGRISFLAKPVSAGAASIQSTLTESDGVVIYDKSRLVKGQNVAVLLLRPLETNGRGI